jgi:isoamylase
MLNIPERLDAGEPYPLGATWDGLGVNFAVFSAHAEKIELCLFDVAGRHEIARLALPECTDEVWHGYLPHAAPGLLYGYRAYGPYEPQRGHRFNPAKLLLDPYATGLKGEIRWSDALFGYRLHSSRLDLSIDRRDSAAAMPKGIVTDDHFSWREDRRPTTPWSDTVIYEAHVRGMTKLLDDAEVSQRGTFAALCHPKVIAHLQRLGITAIELLPVHAYAQDRALLEKGLTNYWGYNTLSFFTPEPRYLSEGASNEMREAVRRLHAAGIEVILDVVYNHTCEGSELGPTLSWRGLDNASYYRLVPGDLRRCINDTGTGNTVNASHPRVLQMIMDSLRHWATSYRVDGFRFDLGATLGREPEGFSPGAGFFDALRQDPVLSTLKLISEPWDIGPGGYQLGHHPPGFAEWNDRFRDGTRKYCRRDDNTRPELAARVAGSGDLIDRRARRPWASVNYVASHDGFTLEDLVSYEHKHNEANGEENNDGTNHDCSSNWGVEGPTDDPNIKAVRGRVKRSMLMTVLGSLGTPMILHGDECGRTQKGNNNAYCQDDEISWFDWSLPSSPDGAALIDFAARLIKLRHQYPLIRCKKFLHGQEQILPGVLDIDWWDERGVQLSQADWENPQGRALIMRRATVLEDGRAEIIALCLNADWQSLTFKLPGEFPWRLLIDSGDPTLGERDLESQDYVIRDAGAILIRAVVERPK